MNAFSRNLLRDGITVVIISAIYLLAAGILLDFKNEQLVLVVIFAVCYLASEASKKFILGFSIFLLYWIVFDFMKIFPNYLFNPVHIETLYQAEKFIFGIKTLGGIVTPNEYFLINHFRPLDFLGGIFYLCWIPIPLVLAIYFYFKKREQFLYFSLNFVLVNVLGWIIYYLYPAAPPWYIHEFGNVFYAHTPGNIAGLSRFDDIIGTPLFYSMYTKSSNVFAAMPSLHSAFPLIVLYYGIKNKLGLINIFFVILTLGIWFTAIYTSHHYTLDVLAGITVCVTGIVIFEVLLKYSNSLKTVLDRYLRQIS